MCHGTPDRSLPGFPKAMYCAVALLLRPLPQWDSRVFDFMWNCPLRMRRASPFPTGHYLSVSGVELLIRIDR